MNTLIEEEIIQIQELFNLSPNELLPNSTLRLKVERLVEIDTQVGSDKINTVACNLAKIAKLDREINLIENEPGYEATKIEVVGEYRYEYRDNITPGDFLRKQRAKLLQAIARDLQLEIDYYSGLSKRV
jgi:hypothetical protein